MGYMTNKEIDEAFEYIEKIAELMYEGLIRNSPDGNYDAEKMRKYNALAIVTNALGIAYMKLYSIRKETTLQLVEDTDEDQENPNG